MTNKDVLIKSTIKNDVLVEFLMELYRQERMEFLDREYLSPMGQTGIYASDLIMKGITWMESVKGNKYWEENYNALNFSII